MVLQTHRAQMSLDILQCAMQEPIKKGERYIMHDYISHEWNERTAVIDYEARPDHLRLPDRFQKQEHKHEWKCECGMNPSVNMEPTPEPEKCAEKPHVGYCCKPKDEVEEKINSYE